jgi:predicted acyl esterase
MKNRKTRLHASLAALGSLLLAAPPAEGQVRFERNDIMVAAGWKPGDPLTNDISQHKTYRNAGWRAKMLRQFPDADADKDGTLTETEATRYHLSKVRRFTPQGGELEYLRGHASRWTERVPMRDGMTLPVEVYLPVGDGPWPTVLVRSARGRIDSVLDYGNELIRAGYAVVGGDLVPEGDFINADVLGREVEGSRMTSEQRAELNARRSQRNAAHDGADTIAWIAKQPWSTGQVGMNGYSEAGAQTKNALSTNPPALKVAVTAIGTLSRELNPFGSRRGAPVDGAGNYPRLFGGWQPPGAPSNNGGSLLASSVTPDVFYNDRTGWFDFAVQGSIREWTKMRSNGKSTLIMGIGGHGRLADDARLAPEYGDADLLLPEITAFEWLRGKDPALARSRFHYFLMGDATNPEAPGNVWKVTETWPVAHDEVSWYLHPDGSLMQVRPSGDATRGYVHDPRRPVETLNGARQPASQSGPRDQRKLDGRDDVLLFTSPVLEQPVEITGEPWVELHVSTDAPDTDFFVQLLDIYPDGYKWPIRENVSPARFHDDAGGTPKPLEAGKVYKLRIPLVATALMLDRGHRLGLQVMSSSYPAYPVHPNTWDAIDSYDQAKPARQNIHTAHVHASRVVLPVVRAGASRDFDPRRDTQ